MSESVVVVGAGLAGLRTVEELRRAGFGGAITLAGAEAHPPYDRPPLSKQILAGTMTPDQVVLRNEDALRELDVTLRLGAKATRLDRMSRKVEFDDGTVLEYDHLVVATGITPRRLPIGTELAGVHVLRTIDDALAFRAELAEAASVLVVGAGFIGCEVAAGLRSAGQDVVLVEGQEQPLAGVLGPEVGELVARLHRAAGVDLRCGVSVAELFGTDRVRGARLSDGAEVAAPVVLSGIGSRPAVEWLQDSGLVLDNGVRCDERGRTNDPRVWAVGDVAAWWDPASGRHLRVEHWTGAGEQAAIVAGELCGTGSAERGVPYFWSDQYDVKLQGFGHFGPDDEVAVAFDDGRRFVALYSRGATVTGAVGGGVPRTMIKLRALLARGASTEEALAVVAATTTPVPSAVAQPAATADR
ncbi:NAD(P)/FAD-dependent oxidoreductase [Nocardia harenae]|uniref:NAD(P)/FAD-dependent oxidoreductase n=1 Tax=Nocardia harenae TaxID=358707 RepID=UPI000A05B3F6|nr:FAD/NAD(P)-binding oxidoreductase [Nocardia harenae]